MEGINQGLFGHQLFFMCPVVFAQTCYNRQTKTKTVFCRAGRLEAFNCHLFLARKACSNGQNPSHSVRHLKAEAERWLGLPCAATMLTSFVWSVRARKAYSNCYAVRYRALNCSSFPINSLSFASFAPSD